MSIPDLPDQNSDQARAPGKTVEPEAPLSSESVPSLGKLVVNGLAVLKGLGLAVGVARFAAPALVGYLAREILEARSGGGATPESPPAPKEQEQHGATAEENPECRNAVPESASVPVGAKEEAVVDEEKGDPPDALAHPPSAVPEEELPSNLAPGEEGAFDAISERPAESDTADSEKEEASTSEFEKACVQDGDPEEGADLEPEVATAIVEEEPSEEAEYAVTEEIEAWDDIDADFDDEVKWESEDDLALDEDPEPADSDSESEPEPERAVAAGFGGKTDDDGDRFWLLESDDQEEIETPAPAHAPHAPHVIAPSPFFAQDEGDAPEDNTSALEDSPVTDDGPQDAPEPPSAFPLEPETEAAFAPPAPAPQPEFPSLLDAPVPETAESLTPSLPIPASFSREKTVLPPRRSAAPPVQSPGAPLMPTTSAQPVGGGLPLPEDDSEFDFDFDPIAIFLQGRAEESEDAPDADPQDKSTALATIVDDNPVVETETEGYPGLAPLSDDEFDALFEAGIPPAATLPRVVIPRKKTPGPLARPEGKLPPHRAPEGAPDIETGSPFPPAGNVPLPASPFLIAPTAEPEALPPLFPKTAEVLPPDLRARRKSVAGLLVLVVALPVLAWAGYYLYHHSELLPFPPKPVEVEVSPAPLPITPVKPDGTAPVLPGALPVKATADLLLPETSASQTAPPPAEAFTLPPLSDDALAAILKDPRETLLAFLAVSNTEDRLRLVHLPEGIRERMEAHAATHGDGPIPYAAVIPKLVGTVPGTSFPTHLFLVTTPSQPDGNPVSVEETSDGFRVDWDAFVQFNDGLFETFLSDPSAPSAEFFVVLRRSHFFGDTVPELEKKFCYRVMSPVTAGVEDYAFIEMGSTAGADAEKSLDWGRSYRPVVRLEWRENGGEKPYLALTELVRTSWRGTGVGLESTPDENAAAQR